MKKIVYGGSVSSSPSPKVTENVQIIPPDQGYNTLATLESILKNPGIGEAVQFISPDQGYGTLAAVEMAIVKGVSDSVSVS